MNRGAQNIIGKHDFTSFMASGSKIVDAVREVYSLNIKRNGDFIDLRISADGFLYNMVRIITGTLVDCAAGTISADDIGKILLSCDRTRAGKTAPPDGLYLADVRYAEDIDWKIE